MSKGIDPRYTFSKEWCGYPEKRHVVRFCGEWVGQGRTKTDALEVYGAHRKQRDREFSRLALEPYGSPAQRKLAAIRARLNGVWDHPCLMAMGPLSSDLFEDIRHILDDPEDALGSQAEVSK